MAEVFGVVAASLSLAQILGETVSGIQKLYDFCSNVRNCPKIIIDAVLELQLLGQVLQHLQNDAGSHNNPIGCITLRYCREVATDLQHILKKLQRELCHENRQRRVWATVILSLQKERIGDIHRRLEKTRSMINLIISSYILMSKQELTAIESGKDLAPALTFTEPTALNSDAGSNKALSVSISQSSDDYTLATTYWTSSFLGLYSYKSWTTRRTGSRNGRGGPDSENEEMLNRTILPAAWLRLWGLSILSTRNCLHWEYRYRPIRVVSDDSPIFHACREGSIQRVSLLVANSRATLQDTSEWGWTLLHVCLHFLSPLQPDIAAMHAQFELCIWLLQQGCNSNTVDIVNGWTPLHAIAALSGRTIQSNLVKKRKELSILKPPSTQHPAFRIQNTIRVLVEQGSYNPLDVSATGWCSLHEYSGPAGPFIYLIRQQQAFCIDFEHFTTEQHNDLAWSLADQYWKNSAELLLIALSNNLAPNIRNSFQPTWNRYRSCTLLHIEAQRLDLYGHAGYPLEYSLKVIERYIKDGADLHARDSFGATPLDDILSYKGYNDASYKQTIISEWIGLLGRSKIDLRKYFQEEESIHVAGSVVHVKYYKPNVVRKFGIKYGNMGKKVTIKVWDEVKEESTEFPLPGSWVEERGGFERDAFGRCICRDTEPCADYRISFFKLNNSDKGADGGTIELP